MNGQRRKEGYLLIDNRASPGVSREFIQSSGKDAPVVGEGEIYESATITCSHCHTVVVLRPDRTRERHYCTGCDHYICDVCADIRKNDLTCRSMKAFIDKVQEQEGRNLNLREI